MRQRLLAQAVLTTAVLIGWTGTAMADFRFNVGQAPDGPPAQQALDVSRPPALNTDDEARSASPVSRFRVAQGFGQSVSLRFAARQIVPPAVTVRFGAGVDPTSLVTWSGGQPWNWVLATAVQPLGMHIVTGASSVLIARR